MFFIAGTVSGCISFNFILVLSVLLAAIYLLYGKRPLLILLCITAFFAGMFRMELSLSYISKQQNIFSHAKSTATFTVIDFPSGDSVFAKTKIDNKMRCVYLHAENASTLSPGDICRANVTYYPTEGSFGNYLLGRGACMRAYADKLHIKGRSGFFVYGVRRYVKNVIKNNFSGDIRAFCLAVILGDKSEMTDSLSFTLKCGGISHIAAVSGLHLSIMVTALLFAMQFVFGKSRFSFLAAAVFSVFIMLATGAGASVVRACIMCVIGFLAQILYKESDALTSLSVAAVLMVFQNPFVVYNIGFVLSVSATLGLILYSAPIKALFLKVFPAYIADTASAGISAQVFTVPAIIYYFGEFSVYGLFVNIIASVFASILVTSGLFMILFSFFKPVFYIFVLCTKGAAALILSVSNAAEHLPFCMLNVSKIGILLLVAWIIIVILPLIYGGGKRTAAVCFAVFAVALSVTGVYMSYNSAVIYRVGNSSYIALFNDNSSYLLGCESYDDISYKSDSLGIKCFDAAFVNSKNIYEYSCAAYAKKVKRVYYLEGTLGKSDLKKLLSVLPKGAVCALKPGESVHTPSGNFSYPNIAENKGEVILFTNGSRKVLLLAPLRFRALSQMHRNGEQIFADSILSPPMLSYVKETAKDVFFGNFRKKENEFFIKG